MDQSEAPIPLEPSSHDAPGPQKQGGLSVVELAAKRGIGPLSSAGARVWHGDARPCVSCGQLVRRGDSRCDQCGQDLAPDMLEKMQAHSGPWYVHEHVRPFPGVSIERLVRQIRRGLLTRTTVVRGPTTHHQWRFAAETPVLSKYLGCCWVCQATVKAADTACGACGVDLNGGFAADGSDGPKRDPAGSAEIRQLTAAVQKSPTLDRRAAEAAPAMLGPMPLTWLVVILAVVTLAIVLLTVRIRAGAREAAPPKTGQSQVVSPDAAPKPAPPTQQPQAAKVEGPSDDVAEPQDAPPVPPLPDPTVTEDESAATTP